MQPTDLWTLPAAVMLLPGNASSTDAPAADSLQINLPSGSAADEWAAYPIIVKEAGKLRSWITSGLTKRTAQVCLEINPESTWGFTRMSLEDIWPCSELTDLTLLQCRYQISARAPELGVPCVLCI